MKRDGQNILIDSDITTTGHMIGRNLSEVIDKQQEDINTLKSNLKWIYKYGGVGSGGAGGGGSASSVPWNFKVEINEVARKDGDVLNLGQPGTYKFKLQIYKIQGRTFDVKITYPDPNGRVKIIQQKILPITDPIVIYNLDLQTNGQITVDIVDDEGNSAIHKNDFVVTAYDFSISYARGAGDDKYTPYYPSDNNIFVNDVKESGLFIDFYYTLAVETSTATYSYTDWSGNTYPSDSDEPLLLKKGPNHIYIPVGIDILDEKAGNYTFKITPSLQLANNVEFENVEPLQLQDNLIPSDLYLKVVTNKTLYNTNNVEHPDQFYTGAINFKVTPFQGPLDKSQSYTFKVYLSNEETGNVFVEQEIPIVRLQDQETYDVDVTTNVEGWNRVKFEISRNGKERSFDYYFFTKSPTTKFNYYPTISIPGNDDVIILPTISAQFKATYDIYKHNNVVTIPGTYRNSSPIQKTKQSAETIYDIKSRFNNIDNLNTQDCLLAFGIRYDRFNDVDTPIITLSSSSSQNATIDIYQNKIKFYGDQKEVKIYLPKEEADYHLLTIYKRCVCSSATSGKLYEYVVYIDGVIEASAGFLENVEIWDTITLHIGLYELNYIEVSYFPHIKVGSSSNKFDFDSYIRNPQNELRDYFNDQDVIYHYYSYKSQFNPESITQIFQDAYSYASLFYADYKTNRIRVGLDEIKSIAKNTDIPVLLLQYIEPRDSGDSNYTSDGESFMSWMEKQYDVNKDKDAIALGYNVNVYYSPGNSELTQVKTATDANFALYLQGTSTMTYISKNYDLVLETHDTTNHTYYYTPNFSNNDTNSFLPETRFTLKADVVDSSHSNNATIGKFVNSVCTPFAGATQSNSEKYSKYVKNALQGFPVLLFIENSYYINASIQETKDDYYFIGITSFNLGRDSEFNLGYKDLRLLPEQMSEGMNIIKINTDVQTSDGVTLNSTGYLSNFGVTEIQDNRNYFDFSQYDDSILFPLNDADNFYMFGKMKANDVQGTFKQSIRNMVESVAKSGGYIFDTLGKNMLPSGGYEEKEGYKYVPASNLVPNYHKQMFRTMSGSNVVLTPKSQEEIKGDATNLSNTLLGDLSNPETLIIPTIDYKSLSEYYVICMALGLLDSVMKNMNLKTWNNKTYYTAFYDMDTSLGKDNAGIDSDYTCFSDYWKPVIEGEEGAAYKVLKSAVSYKDWFDPDIVGFDVPMTYLFALCKYGYHILGDPELEDWYPGNLWARMRRSTNDNIAGWTLPTGGNKNHLGCLASADKFINEYYANYLNKIPDIFFNLDYRKKYLNTVKNDSTGPSYEQESYKKLSGRRIHYVKDWLRNRFHLLDLYFNLNNAQDPIQTYDLESKKWTITPNSFYKLLNTIFIDSSNPDIIILKDIFTTSSTGAKYSTNIRMLVQAEEFSPICVSGNVETNRYITENNTDKYLFDYNTNGKNILLGGSSNWTYVNDINSVIAGNILYVNSDKLKQLNGSGKPEFEVIPQACNEWQLTLPALEEVNLTYSNYTGTLSFNETYRNLKSINISGSKLGLNLNNVPVTSISADSVNTDSNLNILNCSNLKTVSYKNSRFGTISFQLPKSANYNKVFFSPNEYEYKDGVWTKLSTTVQQAYCNTLDIICPTNDGLIVIDDSNISSKFPNKKGIQKIQLQGFKYIYIKSCYDLEQLQIADPSTVESLVINGDETKACCSNATSFRLNSATGGVVDLSNFNQLTTVNFYRTVKFTKVILRDDTILVDKAFSRTSLQKLDIISTQEGGAIKGVRLNTNAFSGSSFTLRDSQGNICKFQFIDSNGNQMTNLSGCFNGCSGITLQTFYDFNQQYKVQLAKLTNISYLWYDNKNLSYSEEDLLNDYMSVKGEGFDKLKYQYFDISMYSGATNASYMFGSTLTNSCHPNMLPSSFGSSNGVNINHIFGWYRFSDSEIVVPVDWLKNIYTKVTSLNINNSTYSKRVKVVQYNSGTKTLDLVSIITPAQIFSNGTTSASWNSKLTTIDGWLFNAEHTLNLTGNPFTNFPNLTTITNSYYGCKGSNLSSKQNIVDFATGETIPNVENIGFLYNKLNSSNNKLKNISGSFGFTNNSSLTIPLDTFLPWSDLNKIYSLTKGKALNIFQYVDGYADAFAFKKTIENKQTFLEILKSVMQVTRSNTTDAGTTSLSHLFQNCVVSSSENEERLTFDDIPENNYITSVTRLFSSFHYINKETAWDWDWNIMLKFKKATSFYYSFANMHFDKNIPFDVFKRRTIDTANNGTIVYVLEEGAEPINDNLIAGYQYRRSYSNTITNVEGCFSNCIFDIPYFVNDAIVYDILNVNSPNFIIYKNSEGDDCITFEGYDRNNLQYANKIKLTNPEFEDFTRETNYAENISGICKRIDTDTEVPYYNYSINNECKNRPLISPDFFYACSNNARISSCFSGSNLQGFIPDNLFKGNCKTPTTISNFLSNALVLPKKHASEVYSLGKDVKLDIWYYIGHNFVLTSDLSSAFNFRIGLPGPVGRTNSPIDGSDIPYNNLHVFCFRDSFPSATSFKNSLPSNINTEQSGCVFVVQNNDHNSYLNPMYEGVETEDVCYLNSVGVNEQGEHIDKDGNVIQGETVKVLGKLGFNYKNSIVYDNLFNSIFTQFCYGNLIDTGTNLYNLNRSSTSNWILQIGNSSDSYFGARQFGVSKYIKLPYLSSALNKSINVYSISYIYDGSKWSSTSDYTKMGIALQGSSIESYTAQVGQRYSDSRVNSDTGYFTFT